jgi:hypothetical protein
VLAVVIDNYSPDARPQSGLSQASMVIETLAEGGITRMLALYLEQDSPRVGPVRSSRVYFDRWASAFHAILVHVGGNDDAQALLWRLPSVFNMDEAPWEYPGADSRADPFTRSLDRFAPYNVFANTYEIRAWARVRHADWFYFQAGIPHKRPAALSSRGHSGSLTVSFVDPLFTFLPPDPDYTVRYVFDRATDTYVRTVGGKPQVDALTHKTLRAANVVVLETGTATPDPAAGFTLESITIPTIGSGTAWYFSDGKVWSGTWQQRDQFAPLRLLGHHGRQIALNPGQTWVEVLPKYSSVSWSFR